LDGLPRFVCFSRFKIVLSNGTLKKLKLVCFEKNQLDNQHFDLKDLFGLFYQEL